MAERHTNPPSPTEPEDTMSLSEPEPQEDSPSSSSEEGKGKVDHGAKMIASSSKPEAASSSDSNQSASSASFSAILPDISTTIAGPEKSDIPSSDKATCVQSTQMPSSLPSTSKSTASPKRCRSERHFALFREIRRMAKVKSRAKQMRRILRNFFDDFPLAAVLESQGLRSPATDTVEMQFPDLTDLHEQVEAASAASASRKAEGGSNAEVVDQFVTDRVNNVTEILDELQGLEEFIGRRNLFENNETPGTSSIYPTQEGESIVHRLAANILDCLKKLRDLAEGLRSWALSQRATVEELKYYMSLLNNLDISTGDSHFVRHSLRSWERSRGAVNVLGDANCVLQVENRLHAILKALIAESHVMHFKYWADQSKSKDRS